jgi:PLP dependent protein
MGVLFAALGFAPCQGRFFSHDAAMLEERYSEICQRIEAACQRAKRDPKGVTLIAVSKTRLPEEVDQLARLGVGHFGENKVQEAKAKIPLCSGQIRWHGIGHLQTNKARDAVRLFHMIHSVDSIRLAQELGKLARDQAKHLPILLEVNVSGESSKFGIKPEELVSIVTEINGLSHLELRGLMTMAPYAEDSEKARPFFRKLAELKREVEGKLGISLPDLSMGMSGDYEVAIEEGATLVRIGTALFGERRSQSFRRVTEDL